MISVYGLQHCSTVKRIVKLLNEHHLEMSEVIDIRENPPSPRMIQKAIDNVDGQYRKVINTSGQRYRELELKDKLDKMSMSEIIQLLSQEGMLIKRPFLTDGEDATAGSQEAYILSHWL